MSVWVAGATVAVGLGTSYLAKKQGDKAADAQGAATEASIALGEEQLDFAKEQYDEQLARYDEWRQIYGPIEENLGDFYNQLTPETYEAAGLEYNQAEFQRAKTQTFETLAQRGLDSSGLAASTTKSLNVASAQERAKIRRDAPFKVAEEKSKFLSQGKGGPTYAPTGPVAAAMESGGARTIGAMQNEANIAAGTASDLWSSAGSLLSTGLKYGAQNYTANVGTTKPDPGSMSLDPNPNPTIQV